MGSTLIRRSRQRFAPPRLERLEDRLAPAVIDVVSTADNNNAVIAAGHAGTAADPFLAPSLRSALTFVNNATDSANNVINLTVAGTYQITLAGTPGETDNLAGEFAILPSGTNGNNLTIQNTSGGAAIVDGNHLNRVFDINSNNNTTTPPFSVTLTGFTITGGDAFDSSANPDGAASSGGGIRDQNNVNLTLNNMLITDNVANADGGGVVMDNQVNSSWTLTVNDSTISFNHAGDAGGGIDTDGAGTVNINPGTVITGNTDANQGAGVYIDAILAGGVFVSATMNMNGALVSNNQAINTGVTASGGGISNAGNGTITITNSTISGNFSGGSGGGFSDENNVGTLVILNSIFLGNSAVGEGGGIQEGGPSTTITNTLIQGNVSSSTGGGLFLNGTTVSLVSSTLVENTSVFGGGGLEIQTTGTGASGSTITNSTFTANSATGNAATPTTGTGGGIDAPRFIGSLTLLNDTLNGNFATLGGGIAWLGGGITFALQNTIVAANFANDGPDAFNDINSFTDNGGNLFGTTIDEFGITPVFTGSPQLGPLHNNGGPAIGAGNAVILPTEALLPGSPALGKGVSTNAPTVDERGFPRPDNGTSEVPDIGAFEFQDAALAISVLPASSTTTLGSGTSFSISVTNTSGNALPADNSTVQVTLSGGLAPTGPLTFTVGPLATGQKVTFTVTATAVALGSQMVSAVVTSPDTSPSSTSSSGTTNVVAAPATTVVTVTGVTDRYTLLTQVEMVTVRVTSGGTPVTVGQVTITDGMKSQTVAIGPDGTVTVSFTFSLLAGQEQPGAHTVSAAYQGTTAFAPSSTSATAAATTVDYFFQLYFDFLIFESLTGHSVWNGADLTQLFLDYQLLVAFGL